jgi:hypothetical protein
MGLGYLAAAHLAIARKDLIRKPVFILAGLD